MNYPFWKYGLGAFIRKQKVLLTILAWGIALTILGRVAWYGWQEITTQSLYFKIGPLTLSVILLVAAFLNGALGWHLVLRAIGVRSSILKDMSNWLIAQVSKYLPAGTLWYFGGRFLQNRWTGLDNSTISFALILEFVLYVMEAFIYAGLSLSTHLFLNWKWLVILMAVVVNASWWLSVSPLLRFARKRLGSDQGWGNKTKQLLEGISGNQLRWLPFFYLFTWTLIGQAVGWLFTSVCPISWIERFTIGGAFSFSSALGYLVFLIPGGWGFREGVLTLIINEIGLCPLGALFSILARFWYTSIEGACVLMGLAISRAIRPRKMCSKGYPKGLLT
jgi:uncharacterized membrane protein YbhN (UPF0104 family)